MNDRRLLDDNPSLETQVALVVQAFNAFMVQDREWKTTMVEQVTGLNRLVATQNGNVASLITRANNHDSWHGRNDEGPLRPLIVVRLR